MNKARTIKGSYKTLEVQELKALLFVSSSLETNSRYLKVANFE